MNTVVISHEVLETKLSFGCDTGQDRTYGSVKRRHTETTSIREPYPAEGKRPIIIRAPPDCDPESVDGQFPATKDLVVLRLSVNINTDRMSMGANMLARCSIV